MSHLHDISAFCKVRKNYCRFGILFLALLLRSSGPADPCSNRIVIDTETDSNLMLPYKYTIQQEKTRVSCQRHKRESLKCNTVRRRCLLSKLKFKNLQNSHNFQSTKHIICLCTEGSKLNKFSYIHNKHYRSETKTILTINPHESHRLLCYYSPMNFKAFSQFHIFSQFFTRQHCHL